LILAILLAGCSKDNPAEPEEDPDLILTQDIGTAGGTISTDSLIVSIPPRAFDSAYAVKLFHGSVASPYDSVAVTDKYRLEGLPGSMTIPVDIYLKTSDSVGDTSWVPWESQP